MARPQPSITQLRPALQLGLDKAYGAPPGRALPGRVRAVVRARRRPANWAVTMIQALEDDDGFRGWIAEEAREEDLGRVAWLWLTRPEGWEDELTALVEQAAAEEESDQVARQAAERIASLERELAAAQEALTDARAAQSRAAAVSGEQAAELARSEAGRRRRLEAEIAERSSRQADMEEERDALVAERDELKHRVESLQTRLEAAEAEAGEAEGRAAASARELAGAQDRNRADRVAAETRRDEVAAAVHRAADAANDLGAALSDAAAALAGAAAPSPDHPTGSGEVQGGDVARAAVAPVASAGSGRATKGAGSRRGAGRHRPVALPLAVFEESPEAAGFLVRVPDMHVLVDGYNVALTSWGDPAAGRRPVPDLPALRRRLLDAVGELAVRVKREVTVIFDGADEGGRLSVPGPARPWLRVVFSPSTVEADEVIVESVRALRPEVPLVVATNDRELRRRAGALGANVISVEQLLAALNRHTPM
jgi:predicted RNA-binding protein with PIN domain